MPAVQQGSVAKRGNAWQARWYGEDGRRQSRGGFATKSEAREFLAERVQEVRALRRGDFPALRRQSMPTLAELAAEYLDQHSGEANTIKTVRSSLARALDKWGEVRIDRISPQEIRAWRRSLPERAAWQYTKALRALLNYAVATKLLPESPAKDCPTLAGSRARSRRSRPGRRSRRSRRSCRPPSGPSRWWVPRAASGRRSGSPWSGETWTGSGA